MALHTYRVTIGNSCADLITWIGTDFQEALTVYAHTVNDEKSDIFVSLYRKDKPDALRCTFGRKIERKAV